MKYNHIVNLNGVYYAAGEDVPIEEDAGRSNDLPFSDSEIEFETTPGKYTREDLEEMTVKEIRQKAEELGFSITKTIRSDVVNEFLEKQM